jgi:K+/H+ antiporter YhaU regulatory subunit KhtT
MATIKMASYQKIALSIAQDIVDGKYAVGEKLSGRSTLASRYKVSSETIRKAMAVLQDVQVVSIKPSSGICIQSALKAKAFLEQYTSAHSIKELRNDLLEWLQRQKQETDAMRSTMRKLLDMTERQEAISPFTPFTFKLLASMNHIGQTSSDLQFWQVTGATIIAILRGDEMLLSPGPYAEFLEGDLLYFIGPKESYERVKNLFVN